MSGGLRPTICEINLHHLKHNAKLLLQSSQNHPFFCPMVKANGYGHGDVQVVKALESLNIKRFGVVLVEEGIRLRNAGIKSDILVFGYFNSSAVKECMRHKLIPVVSSFDYLKCLKSENFSGKIHLKLDTGMSRLGFKTEEWKKLLQEISDYPQVIVEGIATHFLNTDDIFEQDGHTQRQLKLFQEAETVFKDRFQFSHCLNSAALIQNLTFKGARPGLALYGYKPILKKDSGMELKPVMTVRSILSQIKKIKKGEVVSYGATWKATEDTWVGIIPMGYADGLPRALSNCGQVLIQKKLLPVIGRVCMDYCMVNLNFLNNIERISLGEEVVMWGYQGNELLSLDLLAEKTNIVSYEYMTRIGERVPKIFLGENNV